MSRVICDGCGPCKAHGCNNHEEITGRARPTEPRPTGRAKVVLEAGGMQFAAVVYWATDAQGRPSLVVAVPMGDSLDQVGAVARIGTQGEATAKDMLDWLVERVGEGATLQPGGLSPDALGAGVVN